VPPGLLYSPEGIWIKVEANNRIRLGLTYHLYNIVTDLGVEISAKVRLLPVGTKLNRVDAFGSMENFKMLIDLVSPVSGTIEDTNIFYSPDIVYLDKSGFDMYGNGWMSVIKMSDPAEFRFLLSPYDYEATYASTNTQVP
jgi:glycine cleavage system H protein